MDVKVLVGVLPALLTCPLKMGEISSISARSGNWDLVRWPGKTLGIAAKPLVFAEFNLSDEEFAGGRFLVGVTAPEALDRAGILVAL